MNLYSSKGVGSVCLVAFVILPLIGCRGEQDGRVAHVAGLVTVDGAVVHAGRIAFHPDATVGNSGPAGIATIKDGKYDTRDLGGKRVIYGPSIVFISCYAGAPISKAPDMMTNKELIELKKNRNTKPAEYQLKWDIPSDSNEIEKDFDVKAK